MKSVGLFVGALLLITGAAAAQSTLPPLDLESDVVLPPQEIRGVIQARDTAVIAATISARVIDLPRREGEEFAKGDLLVAFDCGRLIAETEAAESEAAAALAEHRSNLELAKYDAIGSLEVQQSRARSNQTAAQVRALKASAVDCEVTAPFDGRVVETLINAFETPSPNQPLLQIINDTSLEVHVIVPSRWLVWMREGEIFQFAVDETATTHTARVARVGAAVDAVSQTVKVIGVFDDRPDRVLSGMSGQAIFTIPEG